MANAANRAAPVAAENLLVVHVSRAAYELIEASGDRRFTELPAVLGMKRPGADLTMTAARAEEFKVWAQETRCVVGTTQRRSLSAAINSIERAIQAHRARECVADPGKDAIQEARREGSAHLSLGAIVVDSDGDLLQVLTGPDFYRIDDENGRHIDRRGRYDWRYGYMVALCEDGGILAKKKYFYPPHELFSKDDGRPTHLKLVRG
ncbi:hypothetical protein AQ962_03620 [Burkholderia pseudomallei]|uniref:hypothetical protein n=1 Tax=Burkholderia pseudomallei TaxID=28450 RepID=UPI000975C7F4|nr:hypothetical protein [Burkholderia pseudomallei]OMW13617.1 hypothetical protein AQ804_29955 [Burkholderia pseudomallei]OMW19927.1 hypothetical protein AQ805_02885 [Burkholderia pseudomallei]ONF14164.1 hypothetical protein AQ962_03620 [Burkholderia pseudomallei]ONF14252.1 hypothetical protein AQ961_22045 [Burkholderia pseudomallei]ONF19209.1 hypothetical protein AQ963_29385 [Burkholderia pseudomallei]